MKITALGTEKPDVGSSADGMHSFEGTDRDADTVTQPIHGGARMMTVIKSDDAPSDYRFALDVPRGEQIIKDGPGFVVGTRTTRNGKTDVAADYVVAPPWAKDAHGKSLPTTYSVSGHTVTMHVDHRGASYPVVADPTYYKGGFHVRWSGPPLHLYVYANKMRSNDLADGGVGACIGFGFIPAVGPILVAACSAAELGEHVFLRYGYFNGFAVTTLIKPHISRYFFYRDKNRWCR